MTDEMAVKIEFLYNTTSKILYNLALYTVGNRSLAALLAADAFADAFKHISDKSDLDQFRIKSTELLYRYMKRTLKKADCTFDIPERKIRESPESLTNKKFNRLTALLFKLSFDERFLLLLFCYQQFSIKQISQITHLPAFITKWRLHIIINKTVNLWRMPR